MCTNTYRTLHVIFVLRVTLSTANLEPNGLVYVSWFLEVHLLKYVYATAFMCGFLGLFAGPPLLRPRGRGHLVKRLYYHETWTFYD